MKFKIVSHAIAIIGILIVIADLLGFFVDKDRLVFTSKILESRSHGVSPTSSGAKKFLLNFLSKDKQENDVLSISNTRIQSAGGTTLSGVVRIVFKDSKEFEACSFEELEDWSRDTGVWIWNGVVVAILGEIFSILISIVENNKSQNRCRGNQAYAQNPGGVLKLVEIL